MNGHCVLSYIAFLSSCCSESYQRKLNFVDVSRHSTFPKMSTTTLKVHNGKNTLEIGSLWPCLCWCVVWRQRIIADVKYRLTVLKQSVRIKHACFALSEKKLHIQILQCDKKIKSLPLRLWLMCGCTSSGWEVYCTLIIATLQLGVMAEACWDVYLIPSQVLSKWPRLTSKLFIVGLFCFSNLDLI